jgi:Protein O-mannosyl-transferase TMEM260-like
VSSESAIPRSILLIAAIYLAAHVAYLTPSLEDIDSINFALGLRQFDVASHQPHPPGYPVYIALGRTSQAVLRLVGPSLDNVRLESLALAIWSALAGAIALLAVYSIFTSLEAETVSPHGSPRHGASAAVWGTALLAASPLFWIAGSRPMSDMPGLAAALVAQALFLKGRTDGQALVIGAVVAGLAAGIRVQTACLTLPLLALALVRQRRMGVWWMASRPLLALAIGGLVWAIPLIVFSGGVDSYLHALGSQADEDFAWTGMLWTTPTPRRLLFALWETFVLPWESIPLGIVVGVLAVAGTVIGVARRRYAVLCLALAFGPYAMFHLLFQETIHVRYAMPTLPAMAWLVVSAASGARAAAPAVSALLVAAALWYAVPTGVAYGQEAHPAFRAISAMKAAAGTSSAVVHAHFSLRRPLQVAGDGMSIVEPRRSYEWLGLVDYWRGGGHAPVWFLADPRRTDLALIDPQSRRDVTHFGWRVADRPELSGTRPQAADWYRFNPPGWFAGEGWGLTPEAGGIAQASRTGVDHRPIEVLVRRRPGPMHLLVGGRHFSVAGDPPVVFALSIDGRPIETWKVDPRPGGVNFLRFLDLPEGLPPGGPDYATLTMTARAEPASRPTPQVAIRQFDIQSSGTLISGFGEGWHEAEYDNATGLSWRWTSGRSILRVSPPQAVVVRLRGESPLKYFDVVPTVKIRAGDRIVGELRPGADFEWTVNIPADAVRSADGAIAIETDRIYLPGEAEGTSDSRQLGLRLFQIDVNPGIR